MSALDARSHSLYKETLMNNDQTKFCPQCGLEVFTGEKFCSSCGASLTKNQAVNSPNVATHVPVVRDSIKPIPEAKAPRPPSLVDGFISGFFGGIFQWVGGLLIPVSFFVLDTSREDGGAGPICFFGGIGLIIWGSYMRYASAHAVRVSR